MSDEPTKPYRSGPLRETHRIPAKHSPDVLGSFVLRLYWKPWDNGRVGWVDFELFEVVSFATDDPKRLFYELRDGSGPASHTEDLDKAQPIADGFVKSDGCTQFDVASVHVDHRRSLEDLFHGIAEARRLCALAMPGSDIILEY